MTLADQTIFSCLEPYGCISIGIIHEISSDEHDHGKFVSN